MIISSASDYREAARRRLPRFLFDYIDGGANDEQTMRANSTDIQNVTLRQRILRNVADLSLKTEFFGVEAAMPVMLAPVGLTGMYARRGEVQAARACENKGVPFIQSTVSVCSLEEISKSTTKPHWFQLYVLKDRGFMRNVLERAKAAGIENLIFTVDMPVPGSRYRDAHSGMSGRYAAPKRMLQAIFKPRWAIDVGLMGKPHDLGNISVYRGRTTGLEDYVGWLGQNFDPSIGWSDLEWIRDFWKGPMIIKGILDENDAADAAKFGANGIVVSNHGGRQLDGVFSSARALPAIADRVGNDLTVLVDGGVRSGLDVVKLLALGAKGVLVGRAAVYALAAGGQAGVENLLDIFEKEMRVAMTLTGVKSVSEISRDLVSGV
jgi:L-lactate dehydrogenase (cytochrome)